jgi:hypothetical protein
MGWWFVPNGSKLLAFCLVDRTDLTFEQVKLVPAIAARDSNVRFDPLGQRRAR